MVRITSIFQFYPHIPRHSEPLASKVLAMERYDNNDTISGSWVVLDSESLHEVNWLIGFPIVDCGNPKDVGWKLIVYIYILVYSIYIYIYINTYVYIIYITPDNHLLTGVDSSHCSVASKQLAPLRGR